MKITKQRLKEIIKEELENSQNEGFFSRLGARLGRANKSFPIHYREFKSMIDDAAEKMNSGRLSSSALNDVAEVVNKDQREQHDELVGRMRKITAELYEKAKEQGNKEAADKARELERRRRRDAEREREEREARRRERERSSSSSSSKKSDFERFMQDDEPYNYMTRMEEGKITKGALKAIIAEELTKAEKSKKKKLEKELDDLKHK